MDYMEEYGQMYKAIEQLWEDFAAKWTKALSEENAKRFRVEMKALQARHQMADPRFDEWCQLHSYHEEKGA